MKITNGPINSGIRSSRSEATEKKTVSESRSGKSRSGGTDRVDLSGGQEVERLTGIIANLPGTNVEKIESIKSRIADGTYHVSGQAVAEKMLRSLGILTGQEAL